MKKNLKEGSLYGNTFLRLKKYLEKFRLHHVINV